MARTPSTTPANPEISREDEVMIREVDEAVREDALYTFLRTHGWKVLGGLVVLIAALGGYMIWHNYAERRLEEQSETLIAALDLAGQRDFKTAAEKVAPLMAEGNSPGARTAARMIQAGAALEQGDEAKASELYRAVAADADAPPVLRDIARIRAVAVNFDRMEPAKVIAELAPLAKPGNPWFGSAGEMVAMAQLESGNRAEAGKLFAAIAKDESLPESLRNRARQMAGLLGVDAVVDVKQLLKDEGIDTDAEAEPGAEAPAAPAGAR